MSELNITDPLNFSHPLVAKISQGYWWKILPEHPRGIAWRDLCGKKSFTLNSGPTWRPINRTGGNLSLEFDGSDDYASVSMGNTHPQNPAVGAGSIALWAKRLSGTALKGMLNLADLGQKFAIAYWETSTYNGIVFQISILGNNKGVKPTSSITVSSWNHFVFTWDGVAGNTPTMYVNGVNVGTAVNPGFGIGPLNVFEVGRGLSSTYCSNMQCDDIILVPFQFSANEARQLYIDSAQTYSPMLNWIEDDFWELKENSTIISISASHSLDIESLGSTTNNISISILDIETNIYKNIGIFIDIESLIELNKNIVINGSSETEIFKSNTLDINTLKILNSIYFQDIESNKGISEFSIANIESLKAILVNNTENISTFKSICYQNTQDIESILNIKKSITTDIESELYISAVQNLNVESLYGIKKSSDQDIEATSSYIIVTKTALLNIETVLGNRIVCGTDIESLTSLSPKIHINTIETLKSLSKTIISDCENLKALAPTNALNVEVTSFFSVISKTSLFDIETISGISEAKLLDVESIRNISKTDTLNIERRLSVTKVFIEPINSLKGVLSNKILHFEIDGTEQEIGDTLQAIVADALINSKDRNVSFIVSDRSVIIISLNK